MRGADPCASQRCSCSVSSRWRQTDPSYAWLVGSKPSRVTPLAGVAFSSVHTHVRESFANLDAARKDLRSAVDSVPEQRRGERPAPDRWSVNEILEHLSLVERRFAAIIALRISEAREAGLGSELGVRQALPASLRHMLDDRASRRNAPDAVQPRGGSETHSPHGQSWSAFAASFGRRSRPPTAWP